MSFLVTIDFKRGCSFAIQVEASTNTAAIAEAKRLAPQFGFTDPVKKAVARPA